MDKKLEKDMKEWLNGHKSYDKNASGMVQFETLVIRLLWAIIKILLASSVVLLVVLAIV